MEREKKLDNTYHCLIKSSKNQNVCNSKNDDCNEYITSHGPQGHENLDFLSLVDPLPASPPPYCHELPIPKVPIYSDPSVGKEELPSYTPTVYKIEVLSLKNEWKTPFQKASRRRWDSCIVELNSTQLNVYRYESSDILIRTHHKSQRTQKDPELYNSRFTEPDELRSMRTFMSKGMLDKDKLIKSYSLQYGKVGIATDYDKKLFVLRLRLETQQFMLNFTDAKMMIDWYLALSVGIDNSLDLSRRPMPVYRTVPYRRWRNRSGPATSSHNVARNHGLSSSSSLGFVSRMRNGFRQEVEEESSSSEFDEFHSDGGEVNSDLWISMSDSTSETSELFSNYHGNYPSRQSTNTSVEEESDGDDFSENTERDRIFNMIRCILPLRDGQKWEGRYIVKDAVTSYDPIGAGSGKPAEHLLKWRSSKGAMKQKHRSLQEYVVTPKGLVATINCGRS